MLPFHQAVLTWRLHLGLTQDALARRAGVTRPNLSAIEQGRREVSLRTLRALAAALGVRSGLLVDGIPPNGTAGEPPPVSREVLERIADAVAFNRPAAHPDEQAAVEALRILLGSRTDAARHRTVRLRAGRRATLAWVRLTSRYGPEAVQALADRVVERQLSHASASH